MVVHFIDIGGIVNHNYLFIICVLVPGQVTGLRKKNRFHIGRFIFRKPINYSPVFKPTYS